MAVVVRHVQQTARLVALPQKAWLSAVPQTDTNLHGVTFYDIGRSTGSILSLWTIVMSPAPIGKGEEGRGTPGRRGSDRWSKRSLLTPWNRYAQKIFTIRLSLQCYITHSPVLAISYFPTRPCNCLSMQLVYDVSSFIFLMLFLCILSVLETLVASLP